MEILHSERTRGLEPQRSTCMQRTEREEDECCRIANPVTENFRNITPTTNSLIRRYSAPINHLTTQVTARWSQGHIYCKSVRQRLKAMAG